MNITLPLKQMTIEEKLQAMEAIWDDLNQPEQEIQPPPWHGKALEAIAAAIDRGEANFDDWETAKQRIRNQIS